MSYKLIIAVKGVTKPEYPAGGLLQKYKRAALKNMKQNWNLTPDEQFNRFIFAEIAMEPRKNHIGINILIQISE